MRAINRREWLAGAGGTAVLVLLGGVAAAAGKPAQSLPKITMFKTPSCGCCGKWAEAAIAAGFEVDTVPAPDMGVVKTRLKVPDSVLSCHTSVVDRYVVEGHVPIDAIKRMLRARPDIRGIGVAGMPIGSPGMEVPGQKAEAFQVLAFDESGKTRPFA